MESKKPTLTPAEYKALQLIVDLAASNIADAEYDHTLHTGRQRRNGGYSKDLRVVNKLMRKWYRELQRVDGEN
jgi:hypothetical protein